MALSTLKEKKLPSESSRERIENQALLFRLSNALMKGDRLKSAQANVLHRMEVARKITPGSRENFSPSVIAAGGGGGGGKGNSNKSEARVREKTPLKARDVNTQQVANAFPSESRDIGSWTPKAKAAKADREDADEREKTPLRSLNLKKSKSSSSMASSVRTPRKLGKTPPSVIPNKYRSLPEPDEITPSPSPGPWSFKEIASRLADSVENSAENKGLTLENDVDIVLSSIASKAEKEESEMKLVCDVEEQLEQKEKELHTARDINELESEKSKFAIDLLEEKCKELDTALDKISTLEHERADSARDNKRLKKKMLEDQSKFLIVAKKLKKQSEDLLDLKNKDERKARERIDKLHKNAQRLSADNGRLKKKYQMAVGDLKQSGQDNKRLQKALDDVLVEAENWQRREKEASELAEKFEAEKKTLEVSLEESLNGIRSKSEEKDKIIANLKQQLHDCEEKIKVSEALVENFFSDKTSLEDILWGSMKDIKSLEDSLKDARSEAGEKQQVILGLQRQLSDLEEKTKVSEAMAESLWSEKVALEETSVLRGVSLHDIRKEVADKEKVIREKEAKIVTLSQQLREKDDMLMETQTKYFSSQGQLRALESKVQSKPTRDDGGSSREVMRDMDGSLESVEHHVNRLQAKIELLNQKMSTDDKKLPLTPSILDVLNIDMY